MPPKAAPVPVAPPGKKITVSVKVFKPADFEGGVDQPATRGLRMRAFTTWSGAETTTASCVTTPLFGEKDSPAVWAPLAVDAPEAGETAKESESRRLVSQVQYSFSKDVKDSEAMRAFHEDCGIFFVFSYIQETSISLVNAFFLDCSSFLLDSSAPLSLRCEVHLEYEAEISVTIDEPFFQWNDILKLEPMMINLKSINSFPMLPDESPRSAIGGTYLTGTISLGSSLQKHVLAFPSNTPRTKKHTQNDALGEHKFPLDLRLCCVPGLGDLSLFHDAMSSCTFSLEIFQDDWLKRAFNYAHTQEYLALLAAEPGGLALPAAAITAPPVAAGKKGAPAGKGAAAAAAAATTSAMTVTTTQPSDLFLAKVMREELARGKEIRAHGSARFRLEGLLNKSNDLLTKFRRKRDGARAEDDHIAAHEDMTLEVRLQKPSRPEKWDLPAEMSLLKALADAKKQNGKTTNTKSSISTAPRHERFLVCGTSFSLRAELHRPRDSDALQFDSDCAIQTIRFGKTLPLPPSMLLSSSLRASQTLTQFAQETQGAQDVQNMQATQQSQESPTRSKKKKRNEENRVELSEDELRAILRDSPFTRMVIRMAYTDDETLRTLNSAIYEINARALPDIQGSIRSYVLTEKEKDAALRGELDVLSGFMVLDDDVRIVVLEGLAAPNCAMEALYTEYLPREQDNNSELSILCNPEVLFPKRAYGDFSPDLRRIRVRGKLSKLARQPEIYDRKQVAELCFSAVDTLLALLRAEDLLSAKRLSLFPTSEALQQLELLYGEAISRADMDGTKKLEFFGAHAQRESHRLQSSQTLRKQRSARLATTSGENDGGEETANDDEESYQRKYAPFEPTDCRNTKFEELLRTRAQAPHRTDFLAEQRELRRAAWRQMLRRQEDKRQLLVMTATRILSEQKTSSHSQDKDDERASRALSRSSSSTNIEVEEGSSKQKSKNMFAEPELPKVYLYSIQSENYKTKAWRELRHRIAADKHANYTLSQEFLSQSISPIDEDEERARNVDFEKSHRLTHKGFQYPKPKTRAELIAHPKKPSEARVMDLQEPFQDNTDTRTQTMVAGGGGGDAQLRERERQFKSQLRPESLFGALAAPQFEHDFDRRLLGDTERLPRGECLNAHTLDRDFFRSVHLLAPGEEPPAGTQTHTQSPRRGAGGGVDADGSKAKPPMIVGGLHVKDKPHPVDRAADILRGEAQTEALKALREKTSHLGKDIGYRPAPLSLFSAEPYVSPRHANEATTAGHTLAQTQSESRTRSRSPKQRQRLRGGSSDASSYDSSAASDSYSSAGGLEERMRGTERGGERAKDFTLYINRHVAEAKSVALVSKRKHPPLDRSQCSGPKWDPPQK